MFGHMIWDFDGTLFDSYPVMASACQTALKEYGHHLEIFEIVSLMKVSMAHAIAVFKNRFQISDSAIQRYREIVREIQIEQMKPYPGIAELLTRCARQGCSHYVFTHRGRTTVELLEAHGMLGLFSDIITSQSGFARKPSPEGVLYLIGKHHIDPVQAVMIGDRGLDIEAGHNAGIHGCLFDPDGMSGAGDAELYARTVEELGLVLARNS